MRALKLVGKRPPRALTLAERYRDQQRASEPRIPAAHVIPLLPYVADGSLPLDAGTKEALRRYLDDLQREAGREEAP